MSDDLLTCLTWNVHRARGNDGVVNPDRTTQAVIDTATPHGPDILALQEADGEVPPHEGLLDPARIAGETGLVHAHTDDALRWGPQSHGFLGSVLFLHPEIAVEAAALVDLPGHCHRGAVVLETRRRGHRVRVVATHLSLSQPLRIVQMRTIGQHIRRRPPMQTILLGDLNEWRPWGGLALSKAVSGLALDGPARASYPVGRSVLPLDRVMAGAGARVETSGALDTPTIRRTSDHRPLLARIRLSG